MVKQHTKESEYIDSLDELVRHMYKFSMRHHFYELGELDYVGVRPDGQWDIYEVKASDKGYNKAVLQLGRAEDYYGNLCLNTFLYIGKTGELHNI